ncbi:MAG: site-specific DNA-methyltransferase, partial [Thermoanaerobaculales bacterium]|nr:site-specific DNA-methyltransferase [Thermoanaerobaculales bacterium]
KNADKAEIERELSKAIEQANSLGADPETLPKVQELRARLATEAVDLGALESEVYDHLFSFFRRYYSEGDFLAKRVYKAGVYAIPYEGEEVKLHWANADQYYIKTSEYLRDYAFRLRPEDSKNPMRVHFRLIDVAEGEHGNVKAAEGKGRAFILGAAGESGQDFMTEEEGEAGSELVILFEYRPAKLNDWPEDQREGRKKPPAQKDLSALAEKRLLTVAGTNLVPWIKELGTVHIKTDGERADYSRLRAHLNRYTARNTFDYFIHKDLDGFLRRELDFYIKNEVMFLDDIENESVPRVEQYLSKIKVIRKIGGKIIDFLAQLEDFQKKLWLKKKFVVETQYCITLGCVPEEFYPEIAANEAQREEWVRLCAIDEIEGDLITPGYSVPVTVEFLDAHPTLMVDTRYFGPDFIAPLLEAIGNIQEQTNGVLFHSENFQALRALSLRYRSKCDAIYIDPPYNTDASAIAYKNDYKDSSWLCLIDNRLSAAQPCLRQGGVTCIAIDDTEFATLKCLIDTTLGRAAVLGVAAIRSNPAGRSTPKGFAEAHEYAVFVAASEDSVVGRLPRSESQLARYSERDTLGRFEWVNFRKHGGREATRAARPRMFYPIFAKHGVVRAPQLEWDAATSSWMLLEKPESGEEAIWPIKDSGAELRWKWGVESFKKQLEHFCARPDQSGKTGVYMKSRMNNEGMLPVTWWDDKQYSATEYGTNLLTRLFGGITDFSFPKALKLVVDCLRAANAQRDSAILDFFAGSGTTGHAVISLNREDGGRRRFILVEMGDYFDTVLLPRLKKVTFTPEWKDGKPKRLATHEEAERSPQIFKVLRLESYEDTLNNLETRRSETQQTLLDLADSQGEDGLREQYLLRYMLDVETRGSQSLLNVQAFTDPMAYRLKVKRPGSDESREVNVDLLETFNWLIGLTVQHIAAPQSFTAEFDRDSEKRLRLQGRLKPDGDGSYWFRTVTGTTPDGRRTLVIWRKLTGNPEQDNLVLDEWFTKQGYSSKDSEFDLIYVNGDNNLENLRAPDETWKVRLIEEDFHRLMFETEGV